MRRTMKKGNNKNTCTQKSKQKTTTEEVDGSAGPLRTTTKESLTQASTPARKSTRIRKGNPRYSEQSQLEKTPSYVEPSIVPCQLKNGEICTQTKDQICSNTKEHGALLKSPESKSKGKEIMFPLEGHIHIDSEEENSLDTSNLTLSSSKLKTPTTTPQKRRLAKFTISDDEESVDNTINENEKGLKHDMFSELETTKTRRRLIIGNRSDEIDKPLEQQADSSKDIQITTSRKATPTQIIPIFEGRITGKWESLTQVSTPARKSTRIRKGNPMFSKQSQLEKTPSSSEPSIVPCQLTNGQVCSNTKDHGTVLKTPEGKLKGKEIMFPLEGDSSKDIQITTLQKANPNQIDPIFEGRITGKWSGHLFGTHNPKLMMMTIMDSKGNEMQVNVDKNQIEKWNNEFAMGVVYRIRYATITRSEGNYKLTPHHYSMTISSETVVEKIEDNKTIPFERYYLRTLEELSIAFVKSDILIDVVGRVVRCETCRPIPTRFGMTNICGVHITNESKTITKLTLWGGVAAKYGNRIHEVANDHPTILATKLLVKDYMGHYCLNSTDFTKIILQPKDLTSTAEEKINFTELEENIGKLSTLSAKRMPEQQITIAMLLAESSNTIQEKKIFAICASIVDFDLNYGIWYPACHSCYSHYKTIGEDKKCNKCNIQPSNTIKRPRLKLEASDGTGTIYITLFGTDAETAMGVPLTNLLPTCEKDDSKEELNEILKESLSKKLIFNISITPKNANFARKNSFTATSVMPQ